MPVDVVETLCDLVRLPSVNPMGRDVAGEEFHEYRVTEYLQRFFERLDLPWRRQTIEPRQDNIVARLDGAIPPEQGGQILVLEAHQDTVPVDGMIIDPWDPQIRGGRIYGRGSCDIKGGLACMLTVLAKLAETRPANAPTIVMACSASEEFGQTGAKRLPELWDDRSFLPRRPDAIIVAEPTLLNVVKAHRGCVRWHCRTRGKAAHSSQPANGKNAIYEMAKVLAVLERYAEEVVGTLDEHPLVGRPTLSVGLISGGISVNTVPDHCRIEIDRRATPNEDPQAAYQHVVDYLQQHLPASVEVIHDPPYSLTPGLPDDCNAALAEALSAQVQAAGHPGEIVGAPYGTDASSLGAAGIPTVVFGPGSIEQAHTVDEWIAIDQLHAMVEILEAFVLKG